MIVPLMTGRRIVVAGDLRVLLGDLNALKRAAEGVAVERGVLAAVLDLKGGAGVLCESGVRFGLRIGTGMREGGEPSLAAGLAWYRGGGSQVASGVLHILPRSSK